jgi:integrase
VRSGIDDLGNGRFQAWIDLGMVDGKRKRQKKVVNGMRAARAEENRLRREAEAGTLVLTNRATVAQLLDAWLENLDRLVDAGSRAPQTVARYKAFSEQNVKPHLGDTRLDALQRSPGLLARFLTGQLESGGAKGGALSPQTVTHIHRMLATALQWAVENEVTGVNPARNKGVKELMKGYRDTAKRNAREKVKGQRLTVEQMQERIREMRGTQLHLPAVIAVSTGMRRGEILGLQWQDIDFAVGTLTVARSLSYTKERGVFTKEPKTDSSRRTVFLPGFALEELRVAKAARGPLAAPGSYVCCRADGSPISPPNFSSNYAAFVKRHGLPPGGMHSLRHSHATWMVTQNVHPKEISKRLGHANIAMTMDLYADAFEEVDRQAAAALDADFRQHVTKDVTKDASRAPRPQLRLVR